MGWTAPLTWTVGVLVTHTLLNLHLKENLDVLSSHGHAGTGGGGSRTLGNLIKTTYADAAAPAAPAAGLTSLFAVATQPQYRPNGGAAVELADANDLHAQTHATAHDPGGADTMAVDAIVGTGSLRTLGTGAQQAAAGDHGH